MKIWTVLGIILLAAGCGKDYEINPAFSENAVTEGSQVVYSPTAGCWNNGGMSEDRIVFSKTVSSGSGSYSEYRADKEAPLFMPTNYEFIYQGRLIGYNRANLKFFEAFYEDGTFGVRELTEKQIAELFPELDLVRISEAEDGVLKIKKYPWQTKSFLLVNDTDQDFYRYSFENQSEAQPFKSLLTVRDSGNIVFSHFGSRDKMFPILTLSLGM